jgi:hypothetical protein
MTPARTINLVGLEPLLIQKAILWPEVYQNHAILLQTARLN